MKQKNFSFRNIAYQESDGTFTGVCLDLDIVEEGHSTFQEVLLSINDAVLSHMQAAEKHGFPKELINRPAPKKYWDRLEKVTKPKARTSSVSVPFHFFTTQPQFSGYQYA